MTNSSSKGVRQLQIVRLFGWLVFLVSILIFIFTVLQISETVIFMGTIVDENGEPLADIQSTFIVDDIPFAQFQSSQNLDDEGYNFRIIANNFLRFNAGEPIDIGDIFVGDGDITLFRQDHQIKLSFNVDQMMPFDRPGSFYNYPSDMTFYQLVAGVILALIGFATVLVGRKGASGVTDKHVVAIAPDRSSEVRSQVLSPDQIRRIVTFIAPSMQTKNERRAKLISALGPRHAVINEVDLSGPASVHLAQLISVLWEYDNGATLQAFLRQFEFGDKKGKDWDRIVSSVYLED